MGAESCPRCGTAVDWETQGRRCSACGYDAAVSERPNPEPPPAPAWPATDIAAGDEDQFRIRANPAQEAASRQASATLFVIAALHVVCTGFALLALPQRMLDDQIGGVAPEQRQVALFIIGGIAVGLAAIYAGLGWWARYQPLPASVVGLSLYVLVACGDALADPSALARGVIVKAIIVVFLVKAVMASWNASQQPVD